MSVDDNGAPGDASVREVAAALTLYSACSGGMLLVNKLTVRHLPYPATITLVQFVSCAASLGAMHAAGAIRLDPVRWETARRFLVYVIAFSVGTYANMQVLAVSNVETVIVVRSTLPMAVCALDVYVRGHDLPILTSWVSFALIAGGAVGYAWHDLRLLASSYGWIVLWWLLLVFQLSYGNALVRSVPFESRWSPVLYNNLLSIPFALVLAAASRESIEPGRLTGRALTWLALSCVVGTFISYSGFWCQRVVSATCFTVLGVSNKIAVVLANQLMWRHHASARGTAFLGLCLLGGTLYRPSRMRRATISAEELRHLSDDPAARRGVC
jgi:GDP-mannose transporter